LPTPSPTGSRLACVAPAFRPAFLLLFLSALVSACSATTLDQARAEVQSRIAKSGADVAIAFRTLDGKDEWFLRADDSFHAASTMKIPVMIELFHQAREGKIKLDDPILIRNQFHSIVDGSIYKLNPGDDSEIDLYKAEGQTRPVSELLDLMITQSSNLATDVLIEKLDVENVRATVHSLHADGMNVLRGVEDDKAYEKDLNDTTTARALLILLQAIANDKAVDADASHQMVEILKRQKFHEAIPAGLPPGIVVAHKTGEITKIHHDAAIVYARRPFILVILTRGIADNQQSAALMADITRILYQAVE
jgi:beta-lactamase class A